MSSFLDLLISFPGPQISSLSLICSQQESTGKGMAKKTNLVLFYLAKRGIDFLWNKEIYQITCVCIHIYAYTHAHTHIFNYLYPLYLKPVLVYFVFE